MNKHSRYNQTDKGRARTNRYLGTRKGIEMRMRCTHKCREAAIERDGIGAPRA